MSRINFVGGTDIAPILGVSCFRSREDVLAEKTGAAPPVKETAAMRRGKDLEPMTRRLYVAETSVGLFGPRRIVDTKRDWLVASLDDHAEGLVVEFKTASAFSKNWLNGLPADYLLQVQHYMHLLGVFSADVFVLFSSDNFKEALAKKDEENPVLDASKYSTQLIRVDYDAQLMAKVYGELDLFWAEVCAARDFYRETRQ